jgi:hypothetical protein
MKKFFVPFFLVLMVLVLAGISMLASGGAQERGMSTAARATATYSAEQFHIQLTAMAVQGVQP